MKKRELQRFEQIKATADLPSPKGAAMTIVRLTQQDSVSDVQLERAIKSDPAFVGRLIKAANAAGRNNGRAVASIKDAVRILGLGVVRNLALGFSLVTGYSSGNCANFDFGQFWNHSLLRGLAFQEVARCMGSLSPEEAFCCGLLADVGRLALATMHPEAYSRLLDELGPDASPEVIREREEKEFLLAHDDLSAAMHADWGLPPPLVDAMYYRFRAESVSGSLSPRARKLINAAAIAEQIADVCMSDDGRRGDLLGRLLENVSTVIGEEEHPGQIVDRVSALWREWGEMLALKTEALPAYVEMNRAALQGAAPGEGVRVLVALADDGERKQIDDMLRGFGYLTLAVNQGDQALQSALDFLPQVLVADAAMNELDGFALVKALRETKFGRGMYMLLLTSDQDEDRLVEAYEVGADDYFLKPVKERLLAARLKAGVRAVQLQEEMGRDQQEMKNFAAELMVTNRRLHEVAVTDPLTGFNNRRYAHERLEQEWAASLRNGMSLSCMMLDLDHFKAVNDTYGHDVGDQLLIEVAAVMKKNLRANDVICRLGGDEFLVISPDADADAVHACAMRLVQAVGNVRLTAPTGETISCGVSVGVATRQEDTGTSAMLVKVADEGLYRAKIAGRQRVGRRLD